MATRKLIVDIRYYESDHENVNFASTPGDFGRLYPFPRSISFLGQRIARKLREYGYVTGTFDHLYVNFTTVLKEHEIRLSPRMPEKWLRYIDYGLDPATVLKMTESQRESFAAECTFRVLKFLGEDATQQQLVERLRRELEASGSELEILHQTKETATYRVVVTYQIRPRGEQSVAWIEYHDKRRNLRGKKRFIALQFYEDVFPLVGNISVAGGTICVTPRKSFKASLDTTRYRVPFVIPISDLVATGE